MEVLETRQLKSDNKPYTAKQIKIVDLPDCYYKQRLSEMVTTTNAPVWVVGKPGHGRVGDWAAYIGFPLISSISPAFISIVFEQISQSKHTPEGTCLYGEKLEENAANEIFPEYSGLKYRA